MTCSHADSHPQSDTHSNTFTICTHMHTDFKVMQTLPAPWLIDMIKVPGVKQTQYPKDLVMTAMQLMADGVPASKVKNNILHVLGSTGKLGDPDRFQFPDQTTIRRWRFAMTHVAR